MVSNKPQPDRCSATVVDKIGLEIATSADTTLTDADFDVVRLVGPDGTATVDAVANYEEVREYLWEDYTASLVAARDEPRAQRITDLEGAVRLDTAVEPADLEAGSPKTANRIWLDISEVATNTTNRDSELQGYCEKYPMREDGEDRCYLHQGGGAPEGNANRMTHGMYAQRTNFYQHLGQDDKEFVEAMVDSWVDNAPFGRDDAGMVNELYRAAIDQLRLWAGVDEFVEDGSYVGLVKEQQVFDGEEVHEIEEEHPANMPYSRLDGDVRQKLKELNVYDSPDAEQAEADQSLAKKLSGLVDE